METEQHEGSSPAGIGHGHDHLLRDSILAVVIAFLTVVVTLTIVLTLTPG